MAAPPSPQAATLLNTDSYKQHHSAEVLVPQLMLMELLSHSEGELREAAMFVRECLEVSFSHDGHMTNGHMTNGDMTNDYMTNDYMT